MDYTCSPGAEADMEEAASVQVQWLPLPLPFITFCYWSSFMHTAYWAAGSFTLYGAHMGIL